MLHIDGPHSWEYTREVAAAFAEAVRVLNHATLFTDSAGLAYPSDVYHVLGLLADGVDRLPQLLQQLSRFLAAEHKAGRLGEDPDGPHHADAAAAVADVGRHLALAGISARALAGALRLSRAAAVGLHQTDGSDR